MTWWPARGTRVRTELEVRRSRFVTTLARVDSEDEARAVIAAVRSEMPDARHHCTAFIVEVPDAMAIERSSDDGEPAGTAGMPMLAVLRSAGVSQVVVLVTRYFGGVLLGTGGLARAYSDAVAGALAEAPRVQPVVRQVVGLEVPLAEAGRIEGALINHGIEVVGADWGASVLLSLALDDVEAALPVVREIVQGDVDLVVLGQQVSEEPTQE